MTGAELTVRSILAKASLMKADSFGREAIYRACFGVDLPADLIQVEALWLNSALPHYGELLWPWRLWQSPACAATHPVFRLRDERLMELTAEHPDWLPAVIIRAESLVNPDLVWGFRLEQMRSASPELQTLASDPAQPAAGQGTLGSLQALLEDLWSRYDRLARRNMRRPDEEAAAGREDIAAAIALVDGGIVRTAPAPS